MQPKKFENTIQGIALVSNRTVWHENTSGLGAFWDTVMGYESACKSLMEGVERYPLANPTEFESIIHGNASIFGRPVNHDYSLNWGLSGTLQRTVNLFVSRERCWNAASHTL